jgi:hypothetical protein
MNCYYRLMHLKLMKLIHLKLLTNLKLSDNSNNYRKESQMKLMNNLNKNFLKNIN